MWTTFEFYRQVLAGTPVWVWVILLALCLLAVRDLYDRSVPPWTVLIAPLVFMAVGAVGTRRSGLALAVWAGIAVLATLAAFRIYPLSKGTRFDPTAQRLFIPGSWVPGALMVVTFLVNYAINVFYAVYPGLARETSTIVIGSTVLGLLTGIFFGRAWKQARLR